MNIKQAGSAESLRQRVENQARSELVRQNLDGFDVAFNLSDRLARLDNIAGMLRNRNRKSQTRISAVKKGLLYGILTDKK